MKKKNVIVVGSGKLAAAVIEKLSLDGDVLISSWDTKETHSMAKSIVVHAGSGRQLSEVYEFCKSSNSVLVELSTGTATLEQEFLFPVIICPNTSILLIKFLSIWKHFGKLSNKYDISILESHQTTKKSLPGTAVDIADAIGFPIERISSVRDPEVQSKEIGIPDEYLAKHAFHRVKIEDGSVSIQIETKVLGHDSYASGVREILFAIGKIEIENRKYHITEFAENGWI
ncbi:MAG: dihydrodipicolinate reductase C-terminal domain-containing protein [Desulfobacterales bacterium]